MKGSLGRKQFLLRLPHDLFDSTKSYADKENLSITRYINRAIEAYIEATDEVDEYLAAKPRLVVVDLNAPRDNEMDEDEKNSPAWWT